jgi:polyphosphate glucokinase
MSARRASRASPGPSGTAPARDPVSADAPFPIAPGSILAQRTHGDSIDAPAGGAGGAKPPVTLAVDIGASHLKAHLLDARGRGLMERQRVETPDPLTPAVLMRTIERMAAATPGFDRVSIGVPGIVHDGVVYSLPLAGDHRFRRVPLAERLAERLGCPVRLLNDAEMHGLGVIRRRGVEVVLTLGSGLGTALYLDGDLGPRLQFIPSPRGSDPPGGPYGDRARRKIGRKRWSQRVERLIQSLRRITNFDHCYLGGGNAEKLRLELDDDLSRIDNTAAALGGVRLWDWNLES